MVTRKSESLEIQDMVAGFRFRCAQLCRVIKIDMRHVRGMIYGYIDEIFRAGVLGKTMVQEFISYFCITFFKKS